MQSSSSADQAMLLAEDDNTFKLAYRLEISQKDSSNVKQLYQNYLKKLHENQQYSALSAAQKKEFDDKYKVEQFSTIEQFRKSAYGRLNKFTEANNKKCTIIVLKFVTEEDAKIFLSTLQQQGIQCKITEVSASKPTLRK